MAIIYCQMGICCAGKFGQRIQQHRLFPSLPISDQTADILAAKAVADRKCIFIGWVDHFQYLSFAGNVRALQTDRAPLFKRNSHHHTFAGFLPALCLLFQRILWRKSISAFDRLHTFISRKTKMAVERLLRCRCRAMPSARRTGIISDHIPVYVSEEMGFSKNRYRMVMVFARTRGYFCLLFRALSINRRLFCIFQSAISLGTKFDRHISS